MGLKKIFEGYQNRIPTMSSYYFLVSQFINRAKFKEFDNEEFFNLTMQLLLFIFNKSIKRKKCIKEDLIYFIEELNLKVYKKILTENDLNELVGYIINGLTNHGKVYNFSYQNFEKEEFENYNVSLLMTTEIKEPNGTYILSYMLTTEGYKLLLATKEYDDMFQIKVSQIIARIRIQEGDYTGAKNEIQDIIYRLNIQQQAIDSYLKAIKGDIYHVRKEKFVDLFSNSLSILTEEMNRYDELKKMVLQLILDQEAYLDGNLSNDILQKIKNELEQLKNLIDGISEVKKYTSKLIDKIQDFRIEYDDILYQMLKSITVSKFNFKEVVLNNVESDELNLNRLTDVYKSLFLPKLESVFYIDTPYKSQRISKRLEDDSIEVENDWDELDGEKERLDQERKDYNEDYYFFFIKELITYGLEVDQFSLKEFLNKNINNKKGKYMELTKNAKLFRDIILNLVSFKDIDLNKIKNDLENTTFTQTEELQIERIFERLLYEDDEFQHKFNKLLVEELDNTISINTEIDLQEMTYTKLMIPDIKFTIITPYI